MFGVKGLSHETWPEGWDYQDEMLVALKTGSRQRLKPHMTKWNNEYYFILISYSEDQVSHNSIEPSSFGQQPYLQNDSLKSSLATSGCSS